MSQLEGLQKTRNLKDIATILGFAPNKLSYILYCISDDKKYSIHEIPKKNGTFRVIKAPEVRLKEVQKRLSSVLSNCMKEILEKRKKHGFSNLSHGFMKGCSIHTNAKLHKNKRYVLNFDLKDFFPSINFGRVRGFFIKSNDLKLHPDVATIIAQIACHENELPQGSPCSPIISNFIAHILDVKLVKLAKQYKCTYSRYADDITFSTNQKEFPTGVASQDKGNPTFWSLSNLVMENITSSGFEVNPVKTLMSYKDKRQAVTGLVVNTKINVPVEYYKTARAMVDNLFRKGTFFIPDKISLKNTENNDEETEKTSLERLEGILNHIYYTKNFQNQNCNKERKANVTGIESLYREFMFYKLFCVNDRPTIICEGQTDPIYIKYSLKKLHKDYTMLVNEHKGKFIFQLFFLRFSKKINDLLHLGGGTGDFCKFIGHYKKRISKYQAGKPPYPVIIITDNDNGAKTIFGSVKENSKIKDININSDKDFYYINNNLYLIKTPHIGTVKETYIEMLFDQEWLDYKLENKTFSPDNNADSTKHYGKVAFAKNVIAKNFAEINFNSFKPLLDRLLKVIQDYESRTDLDK